MVEILTIKCPFCKQKVIKLLHKEASFRARMTRIRAGRTTKYIKNPEKNEIIVDKCPNCGKSKEEIEKRLKEGKALSHEEIIRRAKEAGLPLKIKG